MSHAWSRRAGGALAIAAALLLAGPIAAHADDSPPTLWTLYAGLGLTSGNAADGSGLAYPFEQTHVDLVFEGESYGMERTALGLPIGLRYGMTFGWVTSYSVEGTPAVDHLIDMRSGFSAGTLLPLVDRGALLITAHVSADVWFFRPTWATEDFLMSLYGGARVIYDTGATRFRMQLDLRPIWFGTDRIEYEATVGASRGRYGVRGVLTLGEERRLEGGYRDTTFFGAVEAAW